MTLGRLSALLSAVMVATPFVSVFTTGQMSFTVLILIAPLPPLVVYNWLRDYEDWTVGHVLERIQGETPIADDLDHLLRPPLPHVAAEAEEDGAFVLPGVPALAPRSGGAVRTEPAPPPASTPPR